MDQDLLSSLFESFPDALIAADLDRNIIKVNAAFTTLFGYSEDECLGKPTSILYRNIEDYHDSGHTRFNIDAKNNSDTYILEYKKKNEESFFGETTSAKLNHPKNGPSGFMGIIRDVSYRRKFDEGILNFQKITASDRYSIEAKINLILKLVCDYYDVDLGILSHIEGNDYTIEHCYARDANLKAGAKFKLQDTYCEKTFKTKDINSTSNAAASEFAKLPAYKTFNLNSYIGQRIMVDGKPYGTLNFSGTDMRKKPFTVRDHDIFKVTASWMSYALTKHKYQKNLIKERKEADDKNSAKTSFIANISHEVRTPLNGIMGYTDILSDMVDDPDAKLLAQKIQKAAHGLLDILNDVIDISQIESGEFKIHRETFSPDALCREIVELFMPRALTQNNTIGSAVAPNIPETMIGDAKRIKQILANLVNNSIKFTKDGEIKLSTLYDKEKGHIRFQVSDTGIGIPDDMCDKIFEEYIQADAGVAKKYGGTGLGLAITKNLVKMMNGTISLNSKIGIGTVITIFIPSQPASDDIIDKKTLNQQRQKNKPSEKSKNRPSILLVEDIPMNAEIARAMLKRADCDTEHAENGKQALDFIGNNNYDLILLDIQMPDIDGITVAREARKMGIQTPIVALTAHILEHEVKEFIEAGMDDYLPKPVIYNQLQAAIEKWTQ